MHKIKLLDENSESICNKDIINKKKKAKKIKINDDLFEIAIRQGLIEKDRDGFYFLGNYEKFLVFKNKNNRNIN